MPQVTSSNCVSTLCSAGIARKEILGRWPAQSMLLASVLSLALELGQVVLESLECTKLVDRA